MCRLVESICIIKGKPRGIAYHNERMDRSRQELFGPLDKIDLLDIIKLPDRFLNEPGKIKCRVVYAAEVESVTFELYVQRDVRSLKCVEGDWLDYRYKYADRSGLGRLMERRGDCDDILIIQKGRITDTSFSNIVFSDGERMVTPARPLLQGTMRERLLAEGRITEEEIYRRNLHLFKKVYPINAMNELGEYIVDVGEIVS